MPVLFKEFHDVGCILFSFIPALVDVGKTIAPVKFDYRKFWSLSALKGTIITVLWAFMHVLLIRLPHPFC